MKFYQTILFAAVAFAAFPLSANAARVISVNFGASTAGNPLNDANSVDADETSIVGNSDGRNIGGAGWNNIQVSDAADGGSGPANLFSTATTGSSTIALLDNNGSTAAQLGSTVATADGGGGGFAAFAGVSQPNQTATGDAGLFQSYLNFGGSVPTETLTVSDIAFANGYNVLLFFDIGNASRTYGFTIGSQTFWTSDTPTDSDTNNDGIIDYVQATGTTSATATTNANYIVFRNLSGSSFTLNGVSTGGRAVISGFQIIEIPEPTSLALAVLSIVCCCATRRSRKRSFDSRLRGCEFSGRTASSCERQGASRRL